MISLVIPTLNEAFYLKKTLAGLTTELRNKWQLEVIVSDGGSTDETVLVAKQLGAKVVLPQRGVKQTIAAGRNAGARAAQGEILLFLDADTKPRVWDELLAAADWLSKSQKTVAVAVRVEIEPSERKWRDIFWQSFYNFIFLCHNLLGVGIGRGNCQLIKTAAFRLVGGYKEDLVAGEDSDLFRRLAKCGRVKMLWRVVVYESPRRFRKLGYWRVTRQWFLNYLSVNRYGRSWSRHWPRIS